ncbi:hypothetical protein L6R52_34835, partial [Myxococcota bacterium]|nr:hypothetical protein [Myxococcota bacterium]
INVGAFAAPIVCGLLSDVAGWSAAFIACAVASVAAGAIAATARRPLEEHAPSSAAEPRAPHLATLIAVLFAFSLLRKAIAPSAPEGLEAVVVMALGLPITALVAWRWTNLRRRGAGPSAATTLALGMIGVAIAGVVAGGPTNAPDGTMLSGAVLVGLSLVQFGELFLDPIALAEVTRRAPARFATSAVAVTLVATSGLAFVPNVHSTIASALGDLATVATVLALLVPAAVLFVLARRSAPTPG